MKKPVPQLLFDPSSIFQLILKIAGKTFSHRSAVEKLFDSSITEFLHAKHAGIMASLEK
jgi:hypothetical protein